MLLASLSQIKEIQKPSSKVFSLEAWKKANFVHPAKKVFSINGDYPDIRAAMLARGWIENTEENSNFFNLIWTRSSKLPVDLKDWQIINHYGNIYEISTKKHLCENIKRLVKWQIDPNTFFPRCFNLSDPTSYAKFLDYYHLQAVVNILKKLVKGQAFPQEKVRLAMAICERAKKSGGTTKVQKTEWKTLMNTGLSPEPIDPHLLVSVGQLLEDLGKLDPQFAMSGDQNIWIVKPGCKSRGRNIAIFDNVEGICKHIDREQSWVAQKYIERPLLIKNRKFDIRQWVLVTDMNPLTIWIYDECYLRFSAEDYDSARLDNVYVHLTNNSIVKNSELFHNTTFEGCMWSLANFQAHLAENYDEAAWSERIFPRMKESVIWSLAASSELILNRSKSFEIFGYDFMLDADLNVWLIEVNTSPAMDYSTHVTEVLVKQVLADSVRLVVDGKFGVGCKNVDTGKFKLIHRGRHNKPLG